MPARDNAAAAAARFKKYTLTLVASQLDKLFSIFYIHTHFLQPIKHSLTVLQFPRSLLAAAAAAARFLLANPSGIFFYF
jgi:hypothetical protein